MATEMERIEEEARFEDWLRDPDNKERWKEALQQARENLAQQKEGEDG